MEKEKSDLAQKLDEDLTKFISGLKPTEYKDGWSEENWREEMEQHPMFMSKPLEDGQELPPLVEAIQQLKYDPDANSPAELATSYKEDGNVNFKRKKYRWAVDSYTKGIEAKCDDPLLNAQLYTNRAVAHFHIGNYQKALRDSAAAKNLKPDHIKAYHRGAMSCIELRQFDDCLSWCAEGLKISSEDVKLKELKTKAEAQKKIADRNKRKTTAQTAKKEKEYELTMKMIKERGIRLASGKTDLGKMEQFHFAANNAIVHIVGDSLIWPVFVLYPEYGSTDYIQKFNEDVSFSVHLKEMFDPNALPDWDIEKKYLPENIQIYFSSDECLIEVDKKKPLKNILAHERYVVQAGTPSFIITVRGSDFDTAYRKRHHVLS